MKKLLSASVTLLILGLNANAQDANLSGPYDIVAPSIYGNPSQPVVGQLYYDTQANQFKGINQAGTATVLGLSDGQNPVASSGTSERIERARVSGSATATSSCATSSCTLRQSGSWLASVTRTSTGIYTATVNSGIFSGTPSCIVYPVSGSAVFSFQNGEDNSATSIPSIRFISSSLAATDVAFDIICMGPR